MKYKLRLILAIVVLSISSAAIAIPITGPTSVTAYTVSTYTYVSTSLVVNPTWTISSGYGVIQNVYQSGVTYYCDVLWHQAGSRSIAFFEVTTQKAILNVTITGTSNIPTPTTTFTIGYGSGCGYTNVSRNTAPPTSWDPNLEYDWYWQTTATGAVTTLTPSMSIVRSVSGALFLRARKKTTPFTWSPTSQAVGNIVVHTAIPATPASSSGITVFKNNAGTISVSAVSGVTSYRWFDVPTGGIAVLVTATPSYNVPGSSSGKTFYVSAVAGACESTGRKEVTMAVVDLPLLQISPDSKATIINDQPIYLTVAEPYLTYSWKMNSGSALGTNRDYFATTAGDYTVTVSKAGVSGYGTSLPVKINTDLMYQNMNIIVTNNVQMDHQMNQMQVDFLGVEKNMVEIQYFDDLGRPSQTVGNLSSPMKRDIVTPITYDGYGRETKKFLPYVDGVDGWFKNNALKDPNTTETTEPAVYRSGKQYAFYQPGGLVAKDQYPYSETRLESSPLNRILEQGAPGVEWLPNMIDSYTSTDRTIKKSYETNAATEVLQWVVTAPTTVYLFGTVNSGTASTPVYYSANSLYKNRTKDEQYNEIIEYVDLKGRVVLKRVQAVSGTVPINDVNYASTYFIYDDFGNLVCVIPPEATTQLSTNYYQSGATNDTKESFLKRWAFRYTYDAKRRLTLKQVPGSDPTYMVYDGRDRLILTQEGNQRTDASGLVNKKDWTFTKYDIINRPILTGIYTHTSVLSQVDMQNHVNTQIVSGNQFYEDYNGVAATELYTNRTFPTSSTALLTINYYDNYSFINNWTDTYEYSTDGLSTTSLSGSYTQVATDKENVYLAGQLTGTKTKVLDGGTTWLKSVNYFDKKYRVIQTLTDNYKGGIDRVSFLYDFAGKLLMSKATHTTQPFVLTGRNVTRTFEYDHGGRLLRTWHQIDGGTSVLLSKNDYNELGRLIDKKLHSTVASATDARQSVDYRYNIRGWLTSMNNSSLTSDGITNDDIGDYFGMNLAYANTDLGIGNTASFNGNITGMTWSNNRGLGTIKENGYVYNYDAMNRILGSTFREKASTWTNYTAGEFAESGFSYDLNGNIKSLTRKDKRSTGLAMDILTYYYSDASIPQSNRLLKVTDTGDKFTGFVDDRNNNSMNDYTYDANGNLTRDLNKGIGTTLSDVDNVISYNILNLPETVTKGGNNLRYVYDATGRKLSQTVTSGIVKKRTDYIGDYTYENDDLQFINHEEGRVVVSGTKLIAANHGEKTATMTPYNTATLEAVVQNGTEKYIAVTATGVTPRSGVFPIGTAYNVLPGDRYRIRIKGYRTGTKDAYLLIKTNLGDLNWPGAKLPSGVGAESWLEQIITIPTGASSPTPLQIGLIWDTTVNGEIMYLNEFEITKIETVTPEYQYNLKDHLGNVRVTFTTKQETDGGIATLETVNAGDEQSKFLRYENARKVTHHLFDHTNGSAPSTTPGEAQRLSGKSNEVYGLARSLSVMPGDVINMEVFAKYIDSNQTNLQTGGILDLILQLASAPASTGIVIDGGFYGSSTTSFPFSADGAANTNRSANTGPPKAYLSWLVYDRNYNLNLAKSSYKRMSTAAREYGQNVNHELLTGSVAITEPGYVYVYLSNEEGTNPYEVYFDDFKVDHIKSPLIQTNDYFPFGLTFNSYSRENTVGQDYLYNGKEHQDELNINWMDYGARMYMPDIGRWGVIDPMAGKFYSWSPYTYALDNPVNFIDPDGMQAQLPRNYAFYSGAGLSIYKAARTSGSSVQGSLLILSQAALESGYGKSSPAAKHNNFFSMMGGGSGIKTSHGELASYPTVSEGINVYLAKLQKTWPNAVDLLKKSDISADDFNKAYNTASYEKYPAYMVKSKGSEYDYGEYIVGLSDDVLNGLKASINTMISENDKIIKEASTLYGMMDKALMEGNVEEANKLSNQYKEIAPMAGEAYKQNIELKQIKSELDDYSNK